MMENACPEADFSSYFCEKDAPIINFWFGSTAGQNALLDGTNETKGPSTNPQHNYKITAGNTASNNYLITASVTTIFPFALRATKTSKRGIVWPLLNWRLILTYIVLLMANLADPFERKRWMSVNFWRDNNRWKWLNT